MLIAMQVTKLSDGFSIIIGWDNCMKFAWSGSWNIDCDDVIAKINNNNDDDDDGDDDNDDLICRTHTKDPLHGCCCFSKTRHFLPA